MASLLKRSRSPDANQPSRDPKRARISSDNTESKCEDQDPPPIDVFPLLFPRLGGIHFPVEIQALPHVMKLMDTLVMTPTEAILEAVKTQNVEWVKEILAKFECELSGAMLEAATKGYRDIANLLMNQILATDEQLEGEVSGYTKKGVKEATVAAGANGHVDIVKLLLPSVMKFNTQSYYSSWFRAVRDVLDAAAVKGHVDVVKLMVQHARENRYSRRYSIWPVVDTLALAISRKHVEVANVLMNGMVWDLLKAFRQAVRTGQKPIADKICELYPQQFGNKNLFVELAGLGYRVAVEYLYTNGHDGNGQVGKAFARAAKAAKMNVVQFLLATGRVSTDSFDKAFKSACCGYGNRLNTVVFLYNLKRVSPQGINRSFAAASSVGVMEFLIKNETISEEAMIAAFKKSTNRKHADIVQFLHTQKCVPSELIDKAFVQAAKDNQQKTVECLLNDGRLSAEARGQVFVDFAAAGKEDLATSVYDTQRTPPDSLVKGFIEAAHRGRQGILKMIIKLLSDEKHVPRAYKNKTFVAAAQHGQMSVLRIVCENEDAKWPLEVLKEALDVAGGNHKMAHFIRKLACDQVSKGP